MILLSAASVIQVGSFCDHSQMDIHSWIQWTPLKVVIWYLEGPWKACKMVWRHDLIWVFSPYNDSLFQDQNDDLMKISVVL